MIKDLKMGDYPGLCGWAHCNHKGPKRDAGEKKRQCDSRSRDWSDVAASQGMSAASRSWKRQEQILPWSLQKGPALSDTSTLAPSD